MARGKKYSDEDLERGLQALLEHSGNAAAASRACGIPARTLSDWKTSEFAGEFAELRRQKHEGFIEKVWRVADKALDELIKKLPDMPGKDIAITVGILADKGLAAAGEASKRIDVTSGDRPLDSTNDDQRIDRLFSLLDKARAGGDSQSSD